MDGEAIPIPVPTVSPPHDPDVSPVGSPEIIEAVPQPVSGELQPSQSAVLTDELRDKIIHQVEYYFSDEHLQADNFLMAHLTKNAEGFVPVEVIASFRKMKKLTRDRSLIVAAVRESSLLAISSDDKKVKRLHPLTFIDAELCTVLVENLPDDHSPENIQRIFGEAGKIVNITIREPNTTKEPRKCKIKERLLIGKLHAVVEYESIEAAEKAVASLNNEQDWRFGMRVKFLTRKGKQASKKKGPVSEKHGNAQAPDPPIDEENHHSSEQHDDTLDDELMELFHLIMPMKIQNHLLRMPDGTRGFTMGRGRP